MTPLTCSYRVREVYYISCFIVPCKHLQVDLNASRFMATVNVLALGYYNKTVHNGDRVEEVPLD